MTARIAIVVLCVIVAVTASGAAPARPVRIGGVTEAWGPTPAFAGLREGLLDLGYREDTDFVMGVWFTQGDTAALPARARDLVAQGVDIVIASLGQSARAAQQATSTVPIVLLGGGDPVRSGLVKSLARPGGNITGVTGQGPELGPKRLQVFRDLVPGLKRVLFPYDPADSQSVAEMVEYREGARRLGLILMERPVRTREEAETVIRGARRGEVDGLLATEPTGLNIPGLILERASTIPTMFSGGRFWVERGGLAAYSSDWYAQGRQAARLVDKIVKGANPGTIPIESNSQIEFVVNLKVARAIGLAIPPEVLYTADRIIR
jgi:putative ABC transport system substrate-binding protein